MILYADTSALVKRYVREAGSKEFIALVKNTEAVAISVVGYAETLAAFHRKERDLLIPSKKLHHLISTFKKDWIGFIHVTVSQVLNNHIEALISKHSLRGFDAIHLASAIVLKEGLNNDMIFACADHRLAGAAVKEGFTVFPEIQIP